MKKIIYRILAGTLLFALGCANPLEAGAKKDTDEAIYEDIEKLMDESDWDNALVKLESLSSSFKERHDVIRTWAGVYAGKCGLDFITFTGDLENADLSSSTLFRYFMNLFQDVSVDPASCDLAQTKMEEIGDLPAERTAGDNFFMAVLGMVKMGTYLRSLADTNQDGTTDVTFNSCAAGSFSDANLNNFITGMGLVTNNVSYLPSSVSGSIGSYFTTINTVCGAACTITDPAAVTGANRDVFRDILKTGSGNPTLPAGIETCVNPAVPACC